MPSVTANFFFFQAEDGIRDYKVTGVRRVLFRSRGRSEPGLALCSFDVLGEGARTESDAQRYYDSYAHAIGALGAQAAASVHARSGISVKLSALEPRYTQLQSARVNEQLAPRMQIGRAHV